MKKILMILIKKILMNKTGMKETLMKKTKYITFLGKYKHFFRFGAKKLHSLKYKNKTRNFFSQDWESFSWYMRNFKFFKLRDRKFHSLKYKKNFFLKKCKKFFQVCFWKNMRNLLILEVQSSTSQLTRNFSFFWKKCQAYLILGARKFHFLKYKKNVYWRKYNKVFRNGFFFNFLSLCWKLSQIALGPTTLVSLCWRVFWPKFNICRCITKIP